MKVKNNTVGFIGSGKMGQAIMSGIIKSGFLDAKSIYAYDKNQDILKMVQKNLKVNVCDNLEDLMARCQVVVLATKPFTVNEVLESIEDKVRNHLIISILAGVSTKKIELKLFNTRTVRVMPNTPALVGCGMSVVCGGKFAFDYDVKYVLEMFSSLGCAIEIDEKYIDIVTAISGSGPAFFYYFIDKIAVAGKKLGLDYDVALELAAQTALGSAQMILNTTESPEELIDNVTTPGGCTEIGNNILINSKVEDILFKTIKRTMDKAKKLGG